MSNARFEVVKGKEILRYLNDLSKLRMYFYREYPYLHSSNKETEVKYFEMYAASEESRAIIAKEGDKVVGAILGMPLNEMREKFRAAYNKSGKSVEKVYYMGDILVPKEHRGEGIGGELYEKFESVVREMKRYTEIDFLRVERPKADLRKPKDYQPTEEFWKHRGYHAETGLKAEFRWTDIGAEQDTPHTMVVYLKKVA